MRRISKRLAALLTGGAGPAGPACLAGARGAGSARWAGLAGLAGVALLTVACADMTAPLAHDDAPHVAAAAGGSIAGSYIVVADWSADAAALAADHGIAPRHVYEHLLNGFAAAIPDDVVQALLHDPRVLRVSAQQRMQKLGSTEPAASWGLDRIDQRAVLLDGSYTWDVDAAKVRAYIIDTGIRYSHAEFEGRATFGFDAFAADPTDPLLGYDGTGDCDGHGTHVAGTVGGRRFGVAKRVQLVGVRVLNCAGYGSDADVIAGMDWVAKHGVLPAVANMSLGDVVPTKTLGTSDEIDNAVRALIASGVSLAVAAGNGWGNGTLGADACMFPISNVPEAITVGATTRTDSYTQWTNYGACIDIFAPGSGIMSAYNTNDNATASLSGTSMATPHVAGVAALILAQAPGATPAQVRDVMVAGATQNIVTPHTLNSGASPNNHLLYSRVKVPSALKGRTGRTVPCTPKRQRDGEC
jgi:subtilisin family serine protease